MANAEARGAQFRAALATFPGVIEVRGYGLMIGAVLDRPIARDVVRQCLERGLIINATDETTLRFVPPLIINEEEVKFCLNLVKSCLTIL
jgi:acetylornithine/N-succinyldiaminopimelate aminotransferase